MNKFYFTTILFILVFSLGCSGGSRDSQVASSSSNEGSETIQPLNPASTFPTPTPTPTPTPSPGSTASSVSQWGITWTFDKPYPVGQFINGDFWVTPNVGESTVKITGITPAFASGRHGWMVNPNQNAQAYDDRAPKYETPLLPNPASPSVANPYLAQPGSSIVKAKSFITCPTPGCRPALETAAVLTVLASPPANSGSDLFRPPYFGLSKPLHRASDLRLELLPSFAPVANTPSLASLETRFQRVQLNHITGGGGESGRYIRPELNMDDYGAQMATSANKAALRLMLNDPVALKMPLLIYLVQAGIDMYGVSQVIDWVSEGGHNTGNALPETFAAVLLDNQAMKDFIRNAPSTKFQERRQIFFSENAGTVLWGDQQPESWYWNAVMNGGSSGSKTVKDPYGFIDGGWGPGMPDSLGYQHCCTSQPFKGVALSFVLIPELRSVWNYEPLITYADRWVNFGYYTQPDPCAPYDGNPANRHITWGENLNRPGECILDPDLTPGSTFFNFSCQSGRQCGRFPAGHGTYADEGHYGSDFVDAVWEAYR